MSTLAEQLAKAGIVSEVARAEHEDQVRAAEEAATKERFASVERAQVEELFLRLTRVTTLRRFKQTARSLLLLRPELAEQVLEYANLLTPQDGLTELLEQVTRLAEWLPSIPEEEQEALIKQTLK